MKSRVVALAGLCLGVMVMPAGAAVMQFDLVGKEGTGLLAKNENSPVLGDPPGSGGEVGVGISYDDVANVLTLSIGWGSGNGFVNLTGTATGGHIHGPTISTGTDSFLENTNVKYPLDSLAGWNSSASAGGFIGTVSIAQDDEALLLAGRFYINIHTDTPGLNPSGEIRGNLVPVPEPQTYALVLAGLGLIGFAARHRLR